MSIYEAGAGTEDTKEIRWSAAHRATAPGGLQSGLSWIDRFAIALGAFCGVGVVVFVLAAVSGWSW